MHARHTPPRGHKVMGPLGGVQGQSTPQGHAHTPRGDTRCSRVSTGSVRGLVTEVRGTLTDLGAKSPDTPDTYLVPPWGLTLALCPCDLNRCLSVGERGAGSTESTHIGRPTKCVVGTHTPRGRARWSLLSAGGTRRPYKEKCATLTDLSAHHLTLTAHS